MKSAILTILALAGMILGLSGCGSGSSTANTAQATPTKTTQTQTNAPTQPAAAPVSAGAEKLITIADVEKITGYKGVKTVAKNAVNGAGGDVNFANADDKLIVMVVLSSSSVYEKSKELKEYIQGPTTGFGDEGLWLNMGKISPETLGIIVKKGTQCVQVTTFLALGEKNITGMYVKKDQLGELMKTALSRL